MTLSGTSASHYDENYAARQMARANLSTEYNVAKFEKLISPNFTVLDFGCGGGFLLRKIHCQAKIGVEINPVAAAIAQTNGINVFPSLDCVVPDSIDVAISNHALEHVDNPLLEIKKIFQKVKNGGTFIICVPCDRPSFAFRADDPDFHLFSWSCNNLGNLLTVAGFQVIEAKEWLSRFPPKPQFLRSVLGHFLFAKLSVITALLDRRRSQIRVVARKP